MFKRVLWKVFVSGLLGATAFGQKPVVYPTPPAANNVPQEVLLLFSGDTAEERLLLTLNNNRLEAMTASLVVYTAASVSTQLPDITLVASESKLVELSPLLKSAGLGSQQLGWLKLNYKGTFLELGAQLTLYPTTNGPGVDSPRSLSADTKVQIGTQLFGFRRMAPPTSL